MLTEGAETGGRVLVVEDDEDIADVLRRSLRNEGYDVRTSADGIDALDVAAGFVPDLVVLDLGLPRLDGVEVCRRLRADSDVPILMLTARTETEDRVGGLDSGADDYLVKPFERKELLARIRALLRRRPPRGSASLAGRRPHPQPRHPRGAARRARDRAHQPRVRAARAPDATTSGSSSRASACSTRSGATTRPPRPTRSTSSSPTCGASSRRAASPVSSTPNAAPATS